jgi:hypothetical protein
MPYFTPTSLSVPFQDIKDLITQHCPMQHHHHHHQQQQQQ